MVAPTSRNLPPGLGWQSPGEDLEGGSTAGCNQPVPNTAPAACPSALRALGKGMSSPAPSGNKGEIPGISPKPQGICSCLWQLLLVGQDHAERRRAQRSA